MFFSKHFTRQSNKNGAISVYKTLFSPWQISVDDTGQTTEYTYAMWVHLFKRLRKLFTTRPVQKILMLGLGAGGQIATLHTQFPASSLVVVEYDEEMLALTKELKLYEPHPFPEVLIGDAKDVVPTIQETFDLIIVDLFAGEEPSPLGNDKQFLESLRARLTQDGVLLMNVYKRKEYLETARPLFAHNDTWMFRLNHLGAFWQEQK